MFYIRCYVALIKMKIFKNGLPCFGKLTGSYSKMRNSPIDNDRQPIIKIWDKHHKQYIEDQDFSVGVISGKVRGIYGEDFSKELEAHYFLPD